MSMIITLPSETISHLPFLHLVVIAQIADLHDMSGLRHRDQVIGDFVLSGFTTLRQFSSAADPAVKVRSVHHRS